MIELTENSLHILKERYLIKGSNGNIIETPEQLFNRVATAICNTPELKEKIFNHLCNLDFLPNSPTLMNAGTDMSQLSACFTIEILDDLTSIFNGVKHTALIFQTGGGVGATFEHIRPRGSNVKSTQGVASGPISFMNNYNIATDTIKQGGKRRGAFMALLTDSHPDIFEFIECKDKGSTLSNMNISVSITDKFMKCVIDDLDWNLEFNGKIYKTIKAKQLFNKIVEHAHYCGDPGIVFIDTINRDNKGEWIAQVNPCSEQPLLPYESCNLGSIRISNFIRDNGIDYHKIIDYESLRECIYNVIEFLDLVVDKNNFSNIIMKEIPQLKQMNLETRKIGLGIMGWADTLILLNIPYNSNEAFQLAETTMKFIHNSALDKSIELAKIKGSFPKFNEYYPNIRIELTPFRNANLTTIAPTGTISVIANCSSGIEPIYSIVYKRNLKDTIGKDMYEINSTFLKIAKERGFYSNSLIEKISNNHGSVQNIKEVPEDIKKIFLIAHDISYKDHIRMQASFQKYTQSGISKTINLPSSATVEDVYNSYILAWKSGCKGVTVYRDGSKEHQVFTNETEIKKNINESEKIKDITPINHIDDLKKRDDILPGLTFVKRTGCSTLFITPTKAWNEDGALELFLNKSNEKGGCLGLQDGIAITISVYNRYLESIDHQHATNALSLVTEHLLRKTCRASELAIEKQKQKLENGESVHRLIDSLSCPNAIAQCLKYMLEHDINISIDGSQQYTTNKTTNITTINKFSIINEDKKKCPECGNLTIRQEGCMNDKCIICGWGGCS